MLRELLAQGDGLCLISTRIPVHELGGRMGASMLDLRTLEPEAGALLLRGLGVDGTEQEMRAASEEMGGHSLALTLLGTYLRDVLRGDVRRRREVDLLSPEAEGTEHARRVMASYAAWFRGASPDATDTDVPELRVLRLLGLFDRPANAAILEALRAEPPIEGLTDGLTSTCGKTWDQIVARLRKAGLVLPADTPGAGDGGLDAHPLVRAYFGERLEKERPEVWREGEVFKEVYRRRIHRGDEFYSSKKLGAFGSELAAVSAFFVGGWEEPSAELPEAPISSSPQGVGTVPGVETPGYSRVAPPGLQKERVDSVIERATQTIEISKQNRWLLTIALDHLTLGHAHHLLNHPEAATHHLDHAVEGLRQAGHDEFVARGLLARAAYLHALGADPTPNLDEALDLAERGGMRLFAADAHLLRTRLALSTGDHPLAHRHFEKARDLVNACGYERRRSELDALEAAL